MRVFCGSTAYSLNFESFRWTLVWPCRGCEEIQIFSTREASGNCSPSRFPQYTFLVTKQKLSSNSDYLRHLEEPIEQHFFLVVTESSHRCVEILAPQNTRVWNHLIDEVEATDIRSVINHYLGGQILQKRSDHLCRLPNLQRLLQLIYTSQLLLIAYLWVHPAVWFFALQSEQWHPRSLEWCQ